MVHVPKFAWSACSALACSSADFIFMEPDAVLGPMDPWIKDGDEVYASADVAAAEQGVPMSLVRSRNALRDAAEGFLRARELRRLHVGDFDRSGQARAKDDKLVETLIHGGWGNHWRPIFFEDARDMGLPVAPETDPTWGELARLCWEALPDSDR